MVKAHLPGHGVGVVDLRHRMPAANDLQGAVVHGLGVDADAGHPRVPDDLQLFPGEGIGPPRLHGVLHRAGEQLHEHMGQALELVGVQGRGSTSAHVHRPELSPAPGQDVRPRRHFPEQRRQVRLHQLAFAQLSAEEGAIGAAGGAEGDAHVHVHLLLAGRRQGGLYLHNLPQQLPLFRGHVEDFPHLGASRLQGKAVLHGLVDQAGGADARKAAPGGRDPRQALAQVVEGLLAQALQGALLLQQGNARILARGDGAFPVMLLLPQGKAAVEASVLLPGMPDKMRLMGFLPQGGVHAEQPGHVPQLRGHGLQ